MVRRGAGKTEGETPQESRPFKNLGTRIKLLRAGKYANDFGKRSSWEQTLE